MRPGCMLQDKFNFFNFIIIGLYKKTLKIPNGQSKTLKDSQCNSQKIGQNDNNELQNTIQN